MKQHRQLFGGFIAVVLAEFHHAVLHDVEGGFLIANMKPCALKSTFFDAFKELGKLLCSGQGADNKTMDVMRRRCRLREKQDYRIAIAQEKKATIASMLQCHNAPTILVTHWQTGHGSAVMQQRP